MTFDESYRTVLAKWPVPHESIYVDTPLGATHVNACGPASAPSLVLLHGGGATSTVWFANVAPLAATHRVYAVDQINDAGRSSPLDKIRSRDDLMTWLDGLLDGLGIDAVALCGHSYGGWLSLNYALERPSRVTHLALLDPTMCFAGMRLTYRLHAVPLFLPGPRAARLRAFLRWETGGADLDPDWLDLMTADRPGSSIVMPSLPAPQQFRGLEVPTLVLVAENSRSHHPAKVAANARALLPNVIVEMLPGATHHTIPIGSAARINDRLVEFLTS